MLAVCYTYNRLNAALFIVPPCTELESVGSETCGEDITNLSLSPASMYVLNHDLVYDHDSNDSKDHDPNGKIQRHVNASYEGKIR